MYDVDSTSMALDRVVTRFGRMLRTVGRRRGLIEADIDELIQEVRVRLWRALVDGEKIRSVRTSYVYRTAMSAALDIVRRRRARPEESLELLRSASHADPIPGGGPGTDLERRELADRIERAVAELPEPRDVVVRLYLLGYDRFEIAKLLGWTEPKVRNLMYRGLADLRVLLLREGIGHRRAM